MRGGWTDWLESGRDQDRGELRTRLRYEWRGQSLVGNYQWVHSRDNTDGPFSYVAHYNDIRAEWGRTTGLPVHNFSLVGNLNLPRSISLTIVGSAHSASPYNIITGKDANEDGLFNDRGVLRRNSGRGPDYGMVSVYWSRRVALGRFLGNRDKRPGGYIGLQIDNLLGRKNYLMVDPVESSPYFGHPLAALPGRSIRLSLNLGK